VYSNGGFAIAGHIAETKAGKPWADLIRDELFTPLGITRAGFGAPGTKDTIDQPRGHRGKAAPFKPVAPGPGADNPSAIGPAGTVHIALADWARFVAAHAQGETGAGAAGGFLKPESWKKLHTPLGGKNPNDGYAMGWGITTRPWAKGTREGDVGRVFTHAGSNTMWFAVAWIAPEKNLSILIACNAAGESGPKAADEAAQAMIKALQTAESSGATSSPANPSPETKR
jgi:CubicO group peptidase (beta-lactamase class C family)